MGATANRFDLRRVKETTWGTTPSNPALSYVRNTGESLSESISTEKSQEIRADRATADLIPVDASVGGGVNFEFSYGAYDDLIASALMSAWVDTDVDGSVTTTTDAADNLSCTSAFTNVVVGQMITLRGMTTAANNRNYRVTGKTDNDTITVYPIPNTAETTANANIIGSYCKNGVTEQSYTLVKRFNDAVPVTTQIFTGMRVGGFSLDLATASLITGSFNFIGSDAEWSTNPAFSGETSVAAPTNPVMNAVTNLTDIDQSGTNLCAAGTLANITFELDNQHREQKGVCKLGAVGVVAGQLMVNVSGSQYFENADEANKFKAGTPFSFSFNLQDNLGNQYNFYMPKNKYESFEVNADSLDTDVMADSSFTSIYDEDTDAMIIISRIRASGDAGTT